MILMDGDEQKGKEFVKSLNLQLVRSIINHDEMQMANTLEKLRQFPSNATKTVRYQCTKCRDTGIFQGRQCDCLLVRIKNENFARFFRESGFQAEQCNETFALFNLEYYKDELISDKIGSSYRDSAIRAYRAAKTFAEESIQQGTACRGLYLFGEPGRGKTFLMNCVANQLLEQKIVFLYRKYDRLLADIQSTYSTNAEVSTETLLGAVSQLDVLLLDDLGVEKPSDDAGLKLYRIIDERMINNRPTFITSNFSVGEMGSRYYDEMLGRRIASRIAQMCNVVQIFSPKDIRVIKAKEFRLE